MMPTAPSWCTAQERGAQTLVADQGCQDKQHQDNQDKRHQTTAQASLPVAGNPGVRGLDVTVRYVRTVGMPAQDAANNQNYQRYPDCRRAH
jgi:hypothetical protein